MLQIHPNARTTPAVRAEIARSGEATGVLARRYGVRRYGVSTETIRKWRERGPGDCLDHSARPPPSSGRPKRGQGRFRDYDLGFVHIDIKHLPKLQTANGERRKRYLFVAIDRRSRSVHLAVKDDETEKSAVAFLRRPRHCLGPCARPRRPSPSASPTC